MTLEFHTTPQLELSPPPSTQASSQAKQSAAMDFKRGIKHDVSQYPTLKDEKYFDQFQMTMIAQARAYDIEEVFDSDYTPKTTEDKDLFLEKQKFAFAVLMKCVQTDIGKTLFACTKIPQMLSLIGRNSSQVLNLLLLSFSIFLPTLRLILDGMEQHRVSFSTRMTMLPVSQHYSPGLKKLMLKASVLSLDNVRRTKEKTEEE